MLVVARVKRLLISVNRMPAGYLSKDETGHGEKKYVFTYLPDIRPQQAVSLTMPVRSESYVLGFLHPVFEMSQPEGLLKDHLVNRFSKILSMDDMGLLFLTGRSRIGNVMAEIAPNNTDQELAEIARSTSRHEQQYAVEAKKVVQASEQDWEPLFERLLEDFAVRSGIGGMQPKVLARVAEILPGEQDRFTATTPAHIVKASNREYPYLALNESLCLAVTKQAGLDVPGHQISDNGQVIIIDRFDSKEDGSRYAVEDGCVLQALPAGERYESSMEKLANAILTYLPDKNKPAAAKALFTLAVINTLVRNGDAHLKNFAIMYDAAGDAVLAPPYDITTTQAYASLRDDVPALMMHNTRRWPTIKELVRFGKLSCHLKETECNHVIENVIKALSGVGKTIPAVIKTYPGSEHVCTAMVSRWNDGLKSLYFKKDGEKKAFRTELDKVEEALLSTYGDPYQNRDNTTRPVRQDNSLRAPGF